MEYVCVTNLKAQWRDIVGVSPYSDEVMYLRVKNLPSSLSFQLQNFKPIPCIFTESQLIEKIDEILTTFFVDKGVINPPTLVNFNSWLGIASRKIARDTRRGLGTYVYKNIIFYRGPSQYDRFMFVTQNKDLYGLFLHPDYVNYACAYNGE